jgi:anti-anti-sigma factor
MNVDGAKPPLNAVPIDDVRVDAARIGDGVYVVSLAGEADLYAAPMLERELERVLEKGGERVLVDLLGAYFVDSAFLGLLLKYQRRIEAGGGWLVLVSNDPRVRRTFQITGLDRQFVIEPSLIEAVNRLVKIPVGAVRDTQGEPSPDGNRPAPASRSRASLAAQRALE